MLQGCKILAIISEVPLMYGIVTVVVGVRLVFVSLGSVR